MEPDLYGLMRRWTSRLRRWIHRLRDPRRDRILIRRGGQRDEVPVRIRGTIGLFLECQPIDGSQARYLVDEGQAVDIKEFWRQWRAWGGGPVFWEDGSPYEPWNHSG